MSTSSNESKNRPDIVTIGGKSYRAISFPYEFFKSTRDYSDRIFGRNPNNGSTVTLGGVEYQVISFPYDHPLLQHTRAESDRIFGSPKEDFNKWLEE